MQPHVKNQASDEEEDLESLRLAALQSIKRSLPNTTNSVALLPNKQFKKSNKRGRGCHSNARHHRNGVFGHRMRNSTLVSVPTIESDTCEVKSKESTSKLVLPQDRYCNKQAVTEQKLEVSSKFDRYNDSESDSDSDLEETVESTKLERSSSLEALMQELEKEIHGDSKKVEVGKQSKICEEKKEVIETKTVEPEPVTIESEPVKDIPVKKEKSPKHEWAENAISQTPQMPYSNIQVSYPPIPFLNFNTSPCSVAPFDPHLPYNFPVVNTTEPQPQFRYTPNFERSISPLALNTDILNTITAPLSPRSAAFVLQNREIIERRKKSPRRSYSRSPSPRYRRSNSRSTSPVRQRLSPTNNQRRLASYKRSPPSRYSSPKRCRRLHHTEVKPSPPHKENEVKDPVYSRGSSLSLSPSPERFDTKKSEDKKLTDDPILEARRKKFESDAIPTEGIIRLKPKSDENGQLIKEDDLNSDNMESPELNEDDLLATDDTYIDFNLKVDDLFSDEESDNENEGRFKSKSYVGPAKPVSQFSNGLSTKIESSSEKNKDNAIHSYSSSKYERREKDKTSLHRDGSKIDTSKKVSLKISNPKTKSHISSIENKKIEIKIRNLTNYDDDSDVGGNKDRKDHSRKVEVTNDSVIDRMLSSDTDDNEVDDSQALVNSEGSGDLRAQLSRKRAERQHMIPKVENIPSRLLKNALQGAIFKKLKKLKSKKKEKDLSPLDNVEDNNYAAVRSTSVTNGYGVADINCSTANTERKVRLLHCDSESITTASDGKLPIHQRLGIPGSVNIFNESKIQKKSAGKRSKSRANYEQV